MYMFWQILLFIVLVLLGSAAYAGIQGAPWVPTWKRDIARAKKLNPGKDFGAGFPSRFRK